MKDTTKRTLKILAGSIIKNDSAIEGAKTFPWWVALIMFIVCNFLPIIPIMVNASKTYGASFVDGYTYGYDQALMDATTQLDASNYKLLVKDHQLLAYDNDVEVKNTWEPDENGTPKDQTPIASYVANNNGVKTHILDIYYSDREFNKGTYTIQQLINAANNVFYKSGTNEKYDNSDSSYYIPSYLILYKSGIYSRIYKTGTTTAATSSATFLNLSLDWKNTSDMDLLKTTLEVKDIAPDKYNAKYVAGVLNNWKDVFNTAYKYQKMIYFWAYSGLYYGIYLVLGIFMGLMMFILTRGKRNPNRNLTFWITCKISAWIAFSPAVLAMIVGFFWNAAAGIGFIVLFGLRTMWLSMRQLGPMANQ